MKEIDRVVSVLERYLSPLNARALVERAVRARGLSPETLKPAHVPDVANSLQRGLRLFLREAEAAKAIKEIVALGKQSLKPVEASSVPVLKESDIITARMEARRICDDLGAKSFTIQKVTTIVSELARNIVSYTSGGTLEITQSSTAKSRVVVRATDSGPGIPNLDEIMAGDYRSKTGLGRGLLGTKRLADHFDIITGPSGTSIVAEIEV
jgi:serine/threonine-protein kinase RsbT